MQKQAKQNFEDISNDINIVKNTRLVVTEVISMPLLLFLMLSTTEHVLQVGHIG